MKNNKRIELDVDFIGGQEPLTKAEEEALNEYFSKKKQVATKPTAIKKRSVSNRTTLAQV